MKPKRIVVLGLSLILFSQMVWAQETAQSSLILSDALNEAKKSNPEILATKKKWEEESAKIIAAGSPPDPELGVEFWGKNETWYDVSQTVPFPLKLPLRAQSQAHEARREEGTEVCGRSLGGCPSCAPRVRGLVVRHFH